MAENFFPSLSDSSVLPIKAVLGLMRQNPDFLNDPTCPYSPTVVSFLKDITAVVVPSDAPTEYDDATDKSVYIETEIGRALRDLRDLQDSLRVGDHQEKLAVTKAKVGLIERLIEARKAVWSVREMSQFQNRILAFLDDLCTKDQIRELKLRLRGLKTVEFAGEQPE